MNALDNCGICDVSRDVVSASDRYVIYLHYI